MANVASKKTNAVAFGQYGIVLEKEQLMYYFKGQLTRVADVGPNYTTNDLFELAKRIANNKGITESINFVQKENIVKWS